MYFTLVFIQHFAFLVKLIYLVLLLTMWSFDLLARSSAVLNLVKWNVGLEKDFGVAFHDLYFFQHFTCKDILHFARHIWLYSSGQKVLRMTVRPQGDRCIMDPLRLYGCRRFYKSIIMCLEEMNVKELHTRRRTWSYSAARIVRPKSII